MSLKDYKITQNDIETKGVVAAPDVMSGDPQTNKRIFDRLTREGVAEKVNGLVDALVSSGVEAILKRGDDSIQYIRLNDDNVLEVSTDGKEYFSTVGSGHIIVDKYGKDVSKGLRLQFDNFEVREEDGTIIVHGVAEEIAGAIPSTDKGEPNGVAELDGTGKVPVGQLPSLEDYGAFPAIDARSSNYNMDDILRSGAHFGVYRVNDKTIGTPAYYGVTNRKYGLIFSFASSGSYGVQFAILAGAECPFYRLLAVGEGGLYSWSSVYNGLRPPLVTEIPGATQINLRWENANPTSAFPAQTINFGLDLFDMYIVIARQSTTQAMSVSVIQKVGGSSKLVNLSYSSGINMHVRVMDYFSDGSLKFYDALSNGVTDNTVLIPLYVYGIRGL